MREIEIYINSKNLSEREAAKKGIEELKEYGFNVEKKITSYYEEYFIVGWEK
jgi:hypothetical protein